MRPETLCGDEGSAACSSSRAASLHIELPKVFGAHVLEVFFQLLRRHLVAGRFGERLRRGLAFLEKERGEQGFLREDRSFEAQRDRDAVGRPSVDMHGARTARDVQLRVKSAVLHLRDVYAAKSSTQADDEVLTEIVGERPLALELVHLDHDRLCLWLPDPDGE